MIHNKIFFVFFLLVLLFFGCTGRAGFEIKNDSDYNLRVVFKGYNVDSVERLAQALFFNQSYFDNQYCRPDSQRVKNSDYERWLLECQDGFNFKNKLDYLIDSGNVFSFASGLIPQEYLNYDLTLKQNDKNLIESLDSFYYAEKERHYFYDMLVNNWFEFPLPKKSELAFNFEVKQDGHIPNFFSDSKEILIMLENKVIMYINENNFDELKSGKNHINKDIFYQLIIKNKDIISDNKVKK